MKVSHLIILMSVDLQIFKPPSVLVLFINQSCCSFIYFSFLKGTVVASLSISHQMPRWLYGNCSSLSVSNGPGHVQTLIKIWLKYPLLFVRWSQAHALRWTLHYVCAVCFEISPVSEADCSPPQTPASLKPVLKMHCVQLPFRYSSLLLHQLVIKCE